MHRILLAGLMLLASIICAAAHEYKLGDLTIDTPWSRATPPGAKVGGGYFVIDNHGTAADRLISVTADVSDKVQLHEMSVKDGVMTMGPLPNGVTIPAGSKIEFKPGGYHVMFIDLKSGLKQGDHIKAKLVFEHAGSIDVEFDVGGVGQSKPMQGHNMPM